MAQQRQRRWSLGDEEGFTLPELLVALMLGLLVTFGAMSVVIAAQRAQPRTTERAGQIQQGRAMVERLVRELRQGERVYNPTAASMEIVTRTSGTGCGGSGTASVACRVAYACGSTTCSRSVQLPNGTWETAQAVGGIIGPAVFTYATPDAAQPPDYVGVELRFPNESGSETVTVADGAALRNWTEVPGAP